MFKHLKSLLILSTVALVACNGTGVKTEAAERSAPSSAASQPVTQAPSARVQQNDPRAVAEVSQLKQQNKLDLIANRITAVQDQLLQLKAVNKQMQTQNQILLQQLSGFKQEIASQIEQVSAGPEQTDAQPDELNGVLDQITMMANELTTQVQDGPYRVTSTYTAKGQWVLIRYHRYSGETWLADQGSWLLLEEQVAPGTADYQVSVIRADQDVKGYVAARVNRISGEVWWLKQNSWLSYVE